MMYLVSVVVIDPPPPCLVVGYGRTLSIDVIVEPRLTISVSSLASSLHRPLSAFTFLSSAEFSPPPPMMLSPPTPCVRPVEASAIVRRDDRLIGADGAARVHRDRGAARIHGSLPRRGLHRQIPRGPSGPTSSPSNCTTVADWPASPVVVISKRARGSISVRQTGSSGSTGIGSFCWAPAA